MLRVLKLFGVDPQERGILDHQEWLFFYFWGFKGGFLVAASLWITKQQKVEAGDGLGSFLELQCLLILFVCAPKQSQTHVLVKSGSASDFLDVFLELFVVRGPRRQ